MIDELPRIDKCSYTSINKIVQTHFDILAKIDVITAKYNLNINNFLQIYLKNYWKNYNYI
jgi:hypothetical protein